MGTFTTQELKDIAAKNNASFIKDSEWQIRIVYTFSNGLHTQIFWGNDKSGFKISE